MDTKTNETTRKLGIKIRVERMKRGISQEKLCDLSGVGVQSIGAIERGVQSPTVETVAAIAKAFDMDIHKLFIFDI